ncbi:hypothetical protein VNO78_26949 [Psophocarpus tetragonolobus]|uniref:Uncharacterized protein n=1 Tax=Psophocarpus tetragonolobus TaxID=3891 RepID=A0AAN9S0T7_PSOTE
MTMYSLQIGGLSIYGNGEIIIILIDFIISRGLAGQGFGLGLVESTCRFFIGRSKSQTYCKLLMGLIKDSGDGINLNGSNLFHA